jgi:hypothetical protein
MWWKTARQPFVTQSTAESELVASSEGYSAGRAVSVFYCEAHSVPGQAMPVLQVPLACDNKAAVQITGRAGGTAVIAWRTRHLRI